MRRSLSVALAVVLLVLAQMASAAGYVVILKNGHKIRCKEPMTIDGDNAIITLVTGTVASYPLTQVDLIETERYNQQGLGDAVEIEELAVYGEALPTPTPRLSLGAFVTLESMERNPELKTTLAPTPTPTPGIRLQTYPYHDERVTRAFEKIFDDQKLYLYHTSGGTRPKHFFVQAVTDSEEQVFHALRTVSQAFYLIRQADPEVAPEAVELQMVQTSRKAAGTFRITPELAEELVSGSTSVQSFYIRNVIF
ncbi:MAG TPA: hypothetical protein VLT32_22285 [Candidatus Sulfomarinibacteraceae bacterium]|nr:hypothetical protein [Candidatus Sulfomarinibacteraceae bacterium]